MSSIKQYYVDINNNYNIYKINVNGSNKIKILDKKCENINEWIYYADVVGTS